MARFFIDRPIFAWVLAIVIMLAGILSINSLPVSQYPTIAPPTVTIRSSYPGANAETVENTITKIIEQNMIGLDGYMYMSSSSDGYGSSEIEITFEPGTNPDIAQVQVQNKLNQCTSQLPTVVQQNGIDVKKSTDAFLMVVGLISKDPSIQVYDLADYAHSVMKEPLSRLEGVGDITVFGAEYAMRVWVSPDKLNKYNLTIAEVESAIVQQNAQVTYGSLGSAPAVPGQVYNYTIRGQSRLTSPEEFRNIIIRMNSDGSFVKLQDVADVQLGTSNYQFSGEYNRQPITGIGIRLASGANAIGTSARVMQEVERLKQYMPAGYEVVYPFDTTPFIKISINEVVHTLFEAIILVFLVMYVFLQNIRATIIPTITVPVVLLGTFAIMSVFNFSINTLTMFGVVLAIGLLVDDAIVVVENVERIMHSEGLSPYKATQKSMDQITGALVGIALVLSAVFIPMAFFGGSTGIIYRQFSITIVSAMALSVFTALTLTPALCATILKDDNTEPTYRGFLGVLARIKDTLAEKLRKIALDKFFSLFNRTFKFFTDLYVKIVNYVIKSLIPYIILYIVICVATLAMFIRIPTSFVPEEDQGVLMAMVQLPAGATMERTREVLNQLTDYFLNEEPENVESVMGIAGFSFAGSGQNAGMAFIKLKDWNLRKRHDQHVREIVQRAFPRLMGIREGLVFAFNLPAIPELGTAAGFDMFIQDQSQNGHEALMDVRNKVIAATNAPESAKLLTRVRANGMDDTPMLKIDVDYPRAMSQGLAVSSINHTLSAAWGSSYVDDFMDRNRIKKVYLQSEASSRMSEDDLNKWYVRNNEGKLVPFSSFAKSSWTYGSPRLERFNGVSAVEIQGEAANGISTGQAMDEMTRLVEENAPGYSIAWNGVSFQEKQASSNSVALYSISLLFVFLCLAALYESWSIPFAVMLVVPLGIVGAVGAAYLTQLCPWLIPWSKPLENDVYFQVGLLTTIGLSAKNAILIVEFAKELYDKGHRLSESVIEASRIRLRPILMTSFAFILGVLPLAISTGAGAAGRNEIGICVIGGMLSATVLAVFFVPIFFILVMRYFTKYKPKNAKTETLEVQS